MPAIPAYHKPQHAMTTGVGKKTLPNQKKTHQTTTESLHLSTRLIQTSFRMKTGERHKQFFPSPEDHSRLRASAAERHKLDLASGEQHGPARARTDCQRGGPGHSEA